jgi:2-iminobutanoate/2-iminopropanoate deaminase
MELSMDVRGFFSRVFRTWPARGVALSGQPVLATSADFKLKHSNPSGLWTSPRLTQVVEVQGARMIYLSGQTAADENYKVHSTDFRQQAHAVYDNIDIALKSVGADLRNVVKTTTYLTRADDIPALREVRLGRYKDLREPPANTLLVVSRLAEPEFVIEIDVVAALPA